MVGRPKIDPAIKAERQKECRRLWRLNNREQFNEIKKKSANNRYAEDGDYKSRCKERSGKNYLYRKEAEGLMRVLI